jgi:hypothetical protein
VQAVPKLPVVALSVPTCKRVGQPVERAAGWLLVVLLVLRVLACSLAVRLVPVQLLVRLVQLPERLSAHQPVVAAAV